ncbi:MAG: transglycosylase SLT domain-containing protein [Gluconacetobacter diazotrophicus]|nr:transglycosylase SLT domain-containing protein [Gluconacetobacter diazotrophicus]
MLRRPCRVFPSPLSPFRSLRGLLASGSLLSLLAACAGTPNGPAVPVAQEVANYRAHARSYYAPPGPPSDPWGPYINEASRRFDVPDTWIRAVIGRESGGQQFHAGTLVTSPVGAMGLMQLMAPTYDELRGQYALGDDPYEPHDNIMAGTAYVRQMYDIYGSPGFLAAYNTGPGRLDDFLTRNRPLPRETRQYVAIIGPQIAGIYPSNRSQADLLVAAHNGEDTTQYAAANQQRQSVRDAWTHRGDDNADQPVQVAEAPAPAVPAPAPAYTRSWSGMAPARPAASAVSAAWAARGVGGGAPAPAPVQLASATPAPGAVSAAWAARGVGTAPAVVVPTAPAIAAPAPSADAASAAVPFPGAVSAAWAARGAAVPAPVQVAGAAPAAALSAAAVSAPAADARPWTPAPTAQQVGVVPADPEQPVQVADAAPPVPVRAAPATGPAAAAAPRRQRYALIRSAMAEPAPLGRGAGNGGGARNWSVQVGAFNSSAQASQAAGSAQSRAPTLSRARAEIAPVQTGARGARVFRARLTGLSRDDAMQACQRLAHGRNDCMVVSPDAHS